MHRIAVAATAIVISFSPVLGAANPAHAAPPTSSRPAQAHVPVMEAASKLNAAPATSAQLATARSAPLTVVPLATSISHPQREVFGFVNAFNLGSPTVGYSSWDFSLLTTVAFFDLAVNSGDGHLVSSGEGWNVYHSTTMQSFVNAAHSHGVRVIVSINLHDFSIDPNNQVCVGLQAANAAQTVQWAVSQMQWAGIDGINVNYEGTITTCADGQTNRSELTSFVANLRAAMTAAQPGSYLSIDTFTGSAEDNQEFFDVTGLAPNVDAMFVMAYDMDVENSQNPPLSCNPYYCTNPESPISGYRFNATTSMAQYKALVPASKVILGQPYYGNRGCVGYSNVAHQNLLPNTGGSVYPTYLFASTIPSQTGVSNFAAHRDPIDGVSEWDTWWDTDFNCVRLQFWDDQISLGAKYDLVNRDNLRGVGLFTLDYAGGAPEVWSTLATYFSCPVTLSLAPTQSTTEFSLGMSAGGCSVASYEVQQFDSTLSQGWFEVARTGAASAVVEGYPGHAYQFRVRAHSTGGVVSSWASVSTAVDTTASQSHPFHGLYTLDGYGGIHGDQSPPLGGTAYWGGWSIARVAHAQPGANSPQSGAVLDGYGGLHGYGAPITLSTTAYWGGWDIARDFAFMPDGTGGFVLDGYGGLHAFHVNGSTASLVAQGFAYWGGWDIARKVVIFPDGTGGYTMDGYGGVHAFGINGPPPAAATKVAMSAYWGGWNIARDMVLVPGNGNYSGYTMDGYGGAHGFHPTGDGSVMPAAITTAYWGGWDIARSIWFVTGSATAGYTMDGYGGIHPFGGAPAVTGFAYWGGWDIAKNLLGS